MYTDDNGIVRFEESDNVSPLHTALNTALQSVSTEIEQHQHDKIVGDGSTLVVNNLGALLSKDDTSNTSLKVATSGGHSDLTLEGGSGSSWVRHHSNGNFYLYTGESAGTASSTLRLVAGSDLPVGFRRAGSSRWVDVPAVASGTATVPASTGATSSVQVTFPSGIFTSRPMVIPVSRNTNYSVTTNTPGTTSVTLYARRLTGSTVSSFTVGWIAVQS